MLQTALACFGVGQLIAPALHAAIAARLGLRLAFSVLRLYLLAAAAAILALVVRNEMQSARQRSSTKRFSTTP